MRKRELSGGLCELSSHENAQFGERRQSVGLWCVRLLLLQFNPTKLAKGTTGHMAKLVATPPHQEFQKWGDANSVCECAPCGATPSGSGRGYYEWRFRTLNIMSKKTSFCFHTHLALCCFRLDCKRIGGISTFYYPFPPWKGVYTAAWASFYLIMAFFQGQFKCQK